MTHIISQIYIVQTKHPTTMKIYIIIYVIIHVVSFKTNEWVFSGLAENSSYWYLEVVGSNPAHGRYYISVVRPLSVFTQPIR